MSLKAMAEAIMTELQKLKPDPCKHVGWYAGQITRMGIAEEALGNTPTILVANESETPDSGLTVRTIAGAGRDAVVDIWRVYLIVEDPSGDESAMIGTSAQVGLFELRDTVLAAINRLKLPGQIGNVGLEYQGTKPALIARGIAYADAMTFAIARPIDNATAVVAGVPLQRVDSNINQHDAPTNAKPMGNTRNDF